MLQQRLRVVQGAGGHTAHTVLSKATGRAQQRVLVLGGIVSARHGRAGGPDEGQGYHTLHHALQEPVRSGLCPTRGQRQVAGQCGQRTTQQGTSRCSR